MSDVLAVLAATQRVFLSSPMLSLMLFGAAASVYVLVLGVAVLARGGFTLPWPFSLTRFYALMGWVPCAFIVVAGVLHPRYLLFFVVTGCAGIAGELLVSVLWRRFFTVPIWTYSHRAVLRGDTSTINFLPWAVGAFGFHAVGRMVMGPKEDPDRLLAVMTQSALLFSVGLGIAFFGRSPEPFTRRAFARFCLPIATLAVGLTAMQGPRYLVLLTAFALTGFATEYTYGRLMSGFFERALWEYNHWKIDEGHTSLVTLPLWALGGLYFHFISRAIGL